MSGGEELWQVTGGAEKGGILVREGLKLDSRELPGRLATGALVRQLELKGERLSYQLVEGDGPSTGWISLRVKGKDLLAKSDRQAKESEERRRPDWLRPDGAKGKLLFASIPLKGHIVHLKRIAEWFLGKPGYEIHFSLFHSSIGDVTDERIIKHLPAADESGAGDLMKLIEEGFTKISQVSKDSEQSQTSTTIVDVMLDGMVALLDATGKDPTAQWMKFLVRTFMEVKPDVVICDASCAWGEILSSCCAMDKVPMVIINSPGIPEDLSEVDIEAEDVQSTMLKKHGTEKLANILGVSAQDIAASQAGGAGSSGAGTMPKTMQGLLVTAQAMPQIAPMITGPMARLLGIKPLLFGKMRRAYAESKPPIAAVFPSPRPLMGRLTELAPLCIFPGFLVPLPEPLPDGHVQRGRAALEESSVAVLDASLLDWLYSEADMRPIVYVAFGTICRPTKELTAKLVQALQDGPWRVLWSLKDADQLLPAGLDKDRWRIESFVPQGDVLRCDRVRCFLSHCGANSTAEALACGVPLVCCPFYMDQKAWAALVCTTWNAGVQVDKDGDAEHIQAAVARVLAQPVFGQNASSCSRLMWQNSKSMLEVLGPGMAPPSKNLGPGASMVASLIIGLMAGAKSDEVFATVFWLILQAAEVCSGIVPLELPPS